MMTAALLLYLALAVLTHGALWHGHHAQGYPHWPPATVAAVCIVPALVWPLTWAVMLPTIIRTARNPAPPEGR